jgi:hypothetical protein
MQDRDAEIDDVDIGLGGLTENVVGVELDRFAARFRADRRHQSLQAVLVEHTGSVVQEQRVDVRAHRQLVGLVGVVRIGMDRR